MSWFEAFGMALVVFLGMLLCIICVALIVFVGLVLILLLHWYIVIPTVLIIILMVCFHKENNR